MRKRFKEWILLKKKWTFLFIFLYLFTYAFFFSFVSSFFFISFFFYFLCLSFYLPLFYFIVSWRKLYGEVVCNESKSKGKAGYDFVLSVIPSGISLLIFRICLVLSLFQPPYSTFKIPNFPLPDCPSSPCHISISIIISYPIHDSSYLTFLLSF